MTDVRFRSWTWVGPGTPPQKRKSRYTFKADWSSTLDLFDRELSAIGAQDIVVECGLREGDIRMDGWPRANHAQPEHPGVRLSFSSKFGPLQYATDAFETMAANLRAIALSLEALRKVDRYGVSRRGEQYTGWRALPAGSTPEPEPEPESLPTTLDEAAAVIVEMASSEGVKIDAFAVLHERESARKRLLSWARQAAHPDTGGTPAKFRLFTAAHDILTKED